MTPPNRPPVASESAAAPTERKSPRGELQASGEVRILILDDDPTICKLIQSALAGREYVVDAVSDPAKMEGALSGDPWHIVLLDYVIPGLEPEQMLARVRKLQPEASIIVVTGFPSVDSALNCLRAHTYDYLTKPFEVSKLREVVTRCLESKGLLRMSEDALRESLGIVIRERRKALGLTLAQLADRSRVSLGYLSQIELGKNSGSIETLYRISLGLGMRLSDLFQNVQG